MDPEARDGLTMSKFKRSWWVPDLGYGGEVGLEGFDGVDGWFDGLDGSDGVDGAGFSGSEGSEGRGDSFEMEKIEKQDAGVWPGGPAGKATEQQQWCGNQRCFKVVTSNL